MPREISIKQVLIITVISVLIVLILVGLNRPRLTLNVSGEFNYETGVTENGEPYKGSPDAQIAMILYSDFVCIPCGDFADAIEELSKEFIESGKLRIIFRNFAHYSDESPLAAQAAMCALDQGADKFWQYHDLIIENRGIGSRAYSKAQLSAYAVQIGLDTTKFNMCLNSEAKAKKIQEDYDDGKKVGVTGTPNWFINGRKYRGSYSPAKLRRVLNNLLENGK
ncbi:hypothetical protein AMJ80_08335 [bacterium SM23_31]|nr:MAG: hypothetical protein AMJ80_08335 [bacterium SM23_31]